MDIKKCYVAEFPKLFIDIAPRFAIISNKNFYINRRRARPKIVFALKPSHIRDNFRKAKKYFTEGVDYFKVKGNALKELRASVEEAENFRSPSGYSVRPLPLVNVTLSALLWTVKGAVRHCKMLNTQKV